MMTLAHFLSWCHCEEEGGEGERGGPTVRRKRERGGATVRRKRERGGPTVWRKRERGEGWCHREEEEGEGERGLHLLAVIRTSRGDC